MIKFLAYTLVGIKGVCFLENGWQTISWESVPGTGLAEEQASPQA